MVPRQIQVRLVKQVQQVQRVHKAPQVNQVLQLRQVQLDKQAQRVRLVQGQLLIGEVSGGIQFIII
jgi:hypothetical protein